MDKAEAAMILRARPVSSFGAAEQAVIERVDLKALVQQDPGRENLYRDMVRIIADVYMHAPASPVMLDGEQETYGYLQEIYMMLEAEHLVGVADALERYRREIKFKKAFIRSALYNRIFEEEVEAINQYEIRYE